MATKQPADRSHFILPDLGEGVHEAELIEWKVKVGQKVDEHQTLAEMETDKARVEVPSPWTGVIKELKGAPGDIINVGSILVTYDIGGGASAADKAAPKSAARSQSVATSTAAKPAEEEREDAGTVVGTVGGSLEISSRFARRPEHESSNGRNARALATPAVRRIARELGVDINRVPATGRGGRVTASDVHQFAEVRESGAARSLGRESTSARTQEPTRPAVTVSGDGVSQRIPFRGVRRKIAQALRHSVSTTVHFTVVDEADVTALEKKRRELIFATGEKITLLPFIMTAICRGLQKHPALNANVDDEKEEILLKNTVNLGCAVDTDHGLMVPVLPGADRMSILEMSKRVTDLAQRCYNRTIERTELMGGTFTISNVGSYGGMFATPIINYPEVAILAAGRAKERVVARDGMFALGKVLPLSLSCDHRVVDGAEGARFLNTVVQLLENPEKLLQPS